MRERVRERVRACIMGKKIQDLPGTVYGCDSRKMWPTCEQGAVTSLPPDGVLHKDNYYISPTKKIQGLHKSQMQSCHQRTQKFE